jgi:serine protease Do
MSGMSRRFLKENLLGLSLTCIGILLLAFSLVLYLNRRPATFVLANGNGLDGTDIASLENINRAYERVAQAVLPSVVAIQTTQVRKVQGSPFMTNPFFRQFFGNMFPQMPTEQKAQYLGSGTIVSPDGYILTNNHVVEHATDILVVLHDGRHFKGKLVGADPSTDIAVVKINAGDLPTATLGDSAGLHVGDTVMAFGNPFGELFTMTQGIVSALGRPAEQAPEPLFESFIQTDASINPGNSGGALVNVRGQVIGIPTFILGGNGGPGGQGSSIGIGFAIPINSAKHVMTDLIKTGKVTRGYLGARIQSLDSNLAKEFHVPDTNGALVQDIEPNGPAAKSGLKTGDVVRTFNGKKVESADQLTQYTMDSSPGATATLGILRDGKPMDIRVALGTRPTGLALNGSMSGQEGQGGQGGQSQAPSSGALAGVSVQNLTPDIRQQLGVPAGAHGVVIVQVDPNSPVAQVGLGQGDVIESINRQPVNNVQDFDRLASEAKGQTLLRVIHQGEGAFVVITPGGE